MEMWGIPWNIGFEFKDQKLEFYKIQLEWNPIYINIGFFLWDLNYQKWNFIMGFYSDGHTTLDW